MRVEAITDSFEGVPVAHDEVDYAYDKATNINYGYTDSSSTSYAMINLTRGSGAATYLWYLFDTSSIPDGAVITSVSCKVKCYISQTGSSRVATRQVQLFAGDTAKGSATTITSSTTEQTMSVATWTLDELRNIRLKVYAVRGTSNPNTSYYFRFYGATLTVEYQLDQYYYTVDVSNTSSASVSPLGETEYVAGNHDVLILDKIDGIRVLDNGVNVTDNVVFPEEPNLNYDCNISSIEISSSAHSFQESYLVGKGSNSTSSQRLYAISGVNAYYYLYFDFSQLLLPYVDDFYVDAKCYASNSGDNDFMTLFLLESTGKTRRLAASDEYINVEDTSVYTVKLGVDYSAHANEYFHGVVELAVLVGTGGGTFYGATAYVKARGYTYSIPLAADHTIHVKDFAYYLKIAGAWAGIKKIWVKRNGVWVVDDDYAFNSRTRYINADKQDGNG